MQACSCTVTAEDPPQPIFRAEVNRYRLEAARLGEPLFGAASHGGGPRGASGGRASRIPTDERSVVPLPKLLSQLLVDLMVMPIDKPWGIPQRMMNFFMGRMGQVTNHIEELSRLVSQPLPLAYLQHCRVLLFTYALLFPLSVDAEAGVFENIAMPLITFATLYGFELLAADLENPLGMDEMDLHLLDMVHSLEVSAHQAFNLSEEGRDESRRALRRPFKEFGMRTSPDDLQPWRQMDGDPPPSHFLHYFCWQPMPTLVLAPLISRHGHVDGVHIAFSQKRGIRRLLRRSLMRRRSGEQGYYTRLSTDPDSPQDGKEDGDDVLHALRMDPMIWCHFLALRRPEDNHAQETDPSCSVSPVSGHRELWTLQLEPMLRGTVAASLLGETCHESSDRTRLPSTPRVARSERDNLDPDGKETTSGACAAAPRLAPPLPPLTELCSRSTDLQMSSQVRCATSTHTPVHDSSLCQASDSAAIDNYPAVTAVASVADGAIAHTASGQACSSLGPQTWVMHTPLGSHSHRSSADDEQSGGAAIAQGLAQQIHHAQQIAHAAVDDAAESETTSALAASAIPTYQEVAVVTAEISSERKAAASHCSPLVAGATGLETDSAPSAATMTEVSGSIAAGNQAEGVSEEPPTDSVSHAVALAGAVAAVAAATAVAVDRAWRSPPGSSAGSPVASGNEESASAVAAHGGEAVSPSSGPAVTSSMVVSPRAVPQGYGHLIERRARASSLIIGSGASTGSSPSASTAQSATAAMVAGRADVVPATPPQAAAPQSPAAPKAAVHMIGAALDTSPQMFSPAVPLLHEALEGSTSRLDEPGSPTATS